MVAGIAQVGAVENVVFLTGHGHDWRAFGYTLRLGSRHILSVEMNSKNDNVFATSSITVRFRVFGELNLCHFIQARRK